MTPQEREELRQRAAEWLASEEARNLIWELYSPFGSIEEAFAQLPYLVQNGRIEMAMVWMANTEFTSGGASAGAALLIAGGDGTDSSEARMQAAVMRMGNEEFETKEIGNEVRNLLFDDQFQPFRMRELPSSFAKDGPVRLFDAMLTRESGKAPDGTQLPMVPCMVAPECAIPLIPLPLTVVNPELGLRMNRSAASDPGLVRVSSQRVIEVSEIAKNAAELQSACVEAIGVHLERGDSRAAVVVGLNPLRIAAYTDELDCVAVLGFPDHHQLAQRYGLQIGSRLLTINSYDDEPKKVAADLKAGPGSHRRYTNFTPMIADFLSDDFERIQNRKAEIEEPEWQRCFALGKQYLRKHPKWLREGDPMQSGNVSENAKKGCLEIGCTGLVVFIIMIAAISVMLESFENFGADGEDDDFFYEEKPKPAEKPVKAVKKSTREITLNLPPQDSGNSADALALATLVAMDLNIASLQKPGWMVGIHLDGEKAYILLNSNEREVGNTKWGEKAQTAFDRAVSIRGLAPPHELTVGAVAKRQFVTAHKRTMNGEEAEVDELDQESFFRQMQPVSKAIDGYLLRQNISEEDNAWAKKWAPMSGDLGPNRILAYPPLPTEPWRTWWTSTEPSGTFRAKVAAQNEATGAYFFWRGADNWLPLNDHKLKAGYNEVAQSILNGKEVPVDSENAIPHYVTTRQEQMPNETHMVDNREVRDWASKDGAVETGRLYALAKLDGRETVIVNRKDGTVIFLLLEWQSPKTLQYLQEIREGRVP